MASQGLMLWQEWHVKVAVLSSLLLQALLLLLATFRKRTANSCFSYLVYGIYLLSVKVAFASFYLIVGARFFAMNKMPFGLWAAVMLLHLAGQERLTAHSLEDNNLWCSSTLSIFWQLLVHIGLFIPHGDLPLPTGIMLCLAVWRIVCRAFRLRMGTQEMMVPGILPLNDLEWAQIPPQMLVEADADGLQTVRNAHFLLNRSSLCLLAEIRSSPGVVRQVSEFFRGIKDPSNAIRIAEIELNFIYESFHTDGTIRKHLNDNWSIIYAFLRSFESMFCVVALSFFIISSSNPLRSANISRADYNVTYLLLWGTLALEFLSYIMTVFSDWTIAALGNLGFVISTKLYQFVPQRRRWWSEAGYPIYNNAPGWVRFARNFFRRWCESISKFNFISHSIQTRSLGSMLKGYYMRQLDSLTTRFRFVSHDWYTDQLGNFIFKQLQDKPTSIITSLRTNMWPTDDSYKTSVLVWHIATELLYISSSILREYDHRRYSKVLSDYMAYLLFMKPHFLPRSRLNPLEQSEAARRSIQEIAKQHQGLTFEDLLRRCCQEILDLNFPHDALQGDDYVQSLSLAIFKANELRDRNGTNKEALWREMSEEWVNMLLYAASKYDRLEHVRGLCRGGQLISIVWLLAFHLGFFQEASTSPSTS